MRRHLTVKIFSGANWVLTTADCCDGVALDALFTAANDWDAATFYDSGIYFK